MRNYFKTGSSGWHGRPLIRMFRLINRGLDPEFKTIKEDSLWAKGCIDFDQMQTSDVFNTYYYGEDWYEKIPYHKTEFYAKNLSACLHELSDSRYHNKAILFHRASLCNRTQMIKQLEPDTYYSLKEITKITGFTPFTALMAIGQAIKTGLVSFNKKNSLDWNKDGQSYFLTEIGCKMHTENHETPKKKPRYTAFKSFRERWGL